MENLSFVIKSFVIRTVPAGFPEVFLEVGFVLEAADTTKESDTTSSVEKLTI